MATLDQRSNAGRIDEVTAGEIDHAFSDSEPLTELVDQQVRAAYLELSAHTQHDSSKFAHR